MPEGDRVLKEPLALADRTGEGFYLAELHRLQGTFRLQQSAPDDQAEACFHQVLEIAQNQSAKSWELRASTSLARLWQSQGKRQDAHELLTPVYEGFTEGFDTVDLQEARVLLDELDN